MRVELNLPEPVREPRMWVKHQTVLAMALRSGSLEMGLHRSEMRKLAYDAGAMALVPRHLEKWFRNEDLHALCVAISDAALTAASTGASGDVELRRVDNPVDARLGALVQVVNAERIAGFPSGRVFLDSVEQALASTRAMGRRWPRCRTENQAAQQSQSHGTRQSDTAGPASQRRRGSTGHRRQRRPEVA